jgi:hypothetical protein
VHVYLTYPVRPSWSLLEAMSAAAWSSARKLLRSRKVIRDGENGLLVDFFSTEAIAAKVDEL